MFRWCAYCNRFQGEKAPFDDYSLTHGICASCLKAELDTNSDAFDRLQPIKALHADILAMALAADASEVTRLIERGVQLGMRPLDLLIGLLQPVLHHIYSCIDNGRLQGDFEPHFSAFCDAVFEALRMMHPHPSTRRAQQQQPDFLLLTGPGSHHTLGIRLVAFALCEGGHDARALWPTPPMAHLVWLICTLRPRVLGVSIAQPDHVGFLTELRAELLRHLDELPQLLVGGRAIRAGLRLPPGFEIWKSDNMLGHMPS